MKRLLLMAVTVTATFVGTAALACRLAPTPERVVAGADAVVVVTVVSGEAVGRVREWQPWRARGRLVRVVAGAPGRMAFSFDNSGESAMCDLAFPVPKPGDRWVCTFRGAAQAAGRGRDPILSRSCGPMTAASRRPAAGADGARSALWPLRRRIGSRAWNISRADGFACSDDALSLRLLTGDLQRGYRRTLIRYGGGRIVAGREALERAVAVRPTEIWHDEEAVSRAEQDQHTMAYLPVPAPADARC